MKIENRGLKYWSERGYKICRVEPPIEVRLIYPGNVMIATKEAESFDLLFPLDEAMRAELDEHDIKYEVVEYEIMQ